MIALAISPCKDACVMLSARQPWLPAQLSSCCLWRGGRRVARDVGFRVGGGLTNMSLQLEIEMEGWIDLILGVGLIE